MMRARPASIRPAPIVPYQTSFRSGDHEMAGEARTNLHYAVGHLRGGGRQQVAGEAIAEGGELVPEGVAEQQYGADSDPDRQVAQRLAELGAAPVDDAAGAEREEGAEFDQPHPVRLAERTLRKGPDEQHDEADHAGHQNRPEPQPAAAALGHQLQVAAGPGERK